MSGKKKTTGTVKWFDDRKGFGFITVDDSPYDVFVHHTGIVGDGHRTLDEGNRVIFEVVEHEKGPKALYVQRLPG